MIPGLAALRGCLRVRRVARPAVARPPRPWRGTLAEAARALAPRPRIIRRAVALGCPAGLAPALTAAPPAVPLTLPVPPATPVAPLPLPFGIGGGPLLPPLPPWGAPPAWLPVLPDLPVPPEAVPEPSTLALLLVAVVLLAMARARCGR